ncbi:MAG: putative 2OG-Fe(II) oxygenase [Pseudolabrys sp.]|nr:putative 2OG-Fe(II) oxygenase [Pseudolabrys sp.]
MRDTFGSLAEARYALARQAVAAQPDSPELLFALAEALAARGDHDEYARVFRQAYLRWPSMQPGIADVRTVDEAIALRDATAALIARGVRYAPVLAANAFANGVLGDKAAVSSLTDYDRFFRVVTNAVPHDFAGVDFFGQLGREVKDGLKFYDSPGERAIRQAWRNNRIMESPLPACRAFAAEIHRQVARYIAALPASDDHPFIASCPAAYKIGAWAVVSGSEGHHVAHIHPKAWLSGVYYVVRPEISRETHSNKGWLRVGPPERLDAAQSGWQQRLVEPEPGHLVLMPGYFYHGTEPLGVEQERICIAFDVMPLELSKGARPKRKQKPLGD